MAYAEKRGKGSNVYYLARFSAGNGEWPTAKDERGAAIRYRTRREAEKAASDEETKVRSRTWRDPAAGQQTFGAYVNVWYARQDLSSRTMGNHKLPIETILLPEFGTDPLRDITTVRVTAWERRLRTEEYSEESIRTYREVLHVIMGGVAEGKIDANPATRPRGQALGTVCFGELSWLRAATPGFCRWGSATTGPQAHSTPGSLIVRCAA